MDWKVVLTARANRDLEKLLRRIALDDPVAAEQFGLQLLQKLELLGTAPEIGKLLTERPGARFLPVGPYIVIYRAKAKHRTVVILRFWHGARGKRPLR